MTARRALAACVGLGIFLGVSLGAPGVAQANEGIIGLWQTQPDRKDLVSHIEVARCGEAYCGKVKRAFDPAGREVQTKNVGKELFWGMKPQGDGSYAGGTAYVPLLDTTTKNFDITLQGDRLHVEGRVGFVRGAQVWTRLSGAASGNR